MAKPKEKENRPNEKNENEQMDIETPMDEMEPQPPKKTVRHEWILETTFPDEKSCMDFIEAENCWARKQGVALTIGLKTLYRCHLCKLRGKACSAEIYTISNSAPGDTTYKFYRKNAQHDHEDSGNKVKVMDDAVKAMIKSYIIEGLTLKSILYRLREKKDIQSNRT